MAIQSAKYLWLAASIMLVLPALGVIGGVALGAESCDIEGDFDGDCDVDCDDLALFGQSWMTHPWEDGWNWAHFIKFSTDLRIDAEDLGQMSESWLVGTRRPGSIVSDVNLTPQGGHFALPGGIIIDVPAGAVSEDVSFTIRLLGSSEIEPYLDIGGQQKGFMGGVETDSNGIAFNMPISLTFPVQPLEEPNSLAYVYYLNREDGTLIPDLPEGAAAPTQTSYAMLAGPSTETTYMYDGRDAVAGMFLWVIPPVLHTTVLNEVYDMLGHSDCIANPCRCLSQRAIERSSDYSTSGGCFNVTIGGSVQYLDCEGSPTEGWQMKEKNIQLGVRMTPDRRAVLCGQSLTMGVDVFGLDGSKKTGYDIEVTNSRPDILEVASFGGGLYLLKQVGSRSGTANLVITTDCNVTKTIAIQVGCEIPNVTGLWTVGAAERWWNCQNEEENGIYTDTLVIDFDSQVESSFAGSFEFAEFEFEYTMYYEEQFFGEITSDCEIKDRCAYTVSGTTSYTETYFFPESEDPYIIRGQDTFDGTYKEGVMKLTTFGADTSGDTCITKGGMILRR